MKSKCFFLLYPNSSKKDDEAAPGDKEDTPEDPGKSSANSLPGPAKCAARAAAIRIFCWAGKASEAHAQLCLNFFFY